MTLNFARRVMSQELLRLLHLQMATILNEDKVSAVCLSLKWSNHYPRENLKTVLTNRQLGLKEHWKMQEERRKVVLLKLQDQQLLSMAIH